MPGRWAGIVGSLEPDPSCDVEAALERRRVWQRGVLDQAARRVPEMAAAPDWIAQLLLAADSFIFARRSPDRPDGKSVIAGYPWFGDWGRDTMICLPGLTLATGRREWAREILLSFARFVDRGMLPNVFPGAGDKPDYNTVDAALWFFEAWRAYLEVSDDRESLAQVFPILAEIVEWHLRGTRYAIRVDPQDALLGAGEPGVQLTWMDAKLGDWVVTPRIGKPVEINALWYNALCIMADFAEALGRPADPIAILPSGCAPALPGSTTSGPAVFMTCSTARPAMTARSGRTRSWRSACRTARSRRPGSSRWWRCAAAGC